MSTNSDDVKKPEKAAEAERRKQAEKTLAADVKLAIAILRGRDESAEEILALAKRLIKRDKFEYAWRVLAKARKTPGLQNKPGLYVEIVQKSALSTYKDVNLPLDKRLKDALTILTDEAHLATTDNQETLGLAGAIYKRMWEADGKREHLEQSLYYYEKGYTKELKKEDAAKGYTGVNADQGYTAINAAYVSDLLGYVEADVNPARAAERRDGARLIRKRIVAEVPRLIEPPLVDEPPLAANVGSNADFKGYWFFYSTIGEAYFGLGKYDDAYRWLVTEPQAAGVKVSEWELETAARQLASLARIQIAAAGAPDADFEQQQPWRELERFLRGTALSSKGGVSSSAVRHGFDGKFGLALSGGGFRASLFHIGVLARLAELDVLRRVEVISCVSGGSIIGAHYYLKVRHLLQTKRDEEIKREDYMRLVRELDEEFVAGVQRNIRARVAASLPASLKMLLKPGYSRTLRLGELYEEELFARVADRDDDARKKPRYMHELLIRPLIGEGVHWDDFHPRRHNWRRAAKAPILVLNAATLNTGHNWQFTATYMGESPAAIHAEVDSVYRLRRKAYTDEPDSGDSPQQIRLGHAVAASSCVPVLFEPVILKDVYERETERDGRKKVSVRLVDGGACDNQGVASLLEQDCNVLLVSDSSGQMEPDDIPSVASLLVALRTNSVLQARVRGTQYGELAARQRTSLLRGLMFVHLKKDLDNNPVDWKGCPSQLRIAPADTAKDLTKYGIAKDTQRRLALIRTDLDTFCDLEAFALMTSAYRMTAHEHKSCFGESPKQEDDGQWRFLEVEEAMNETGPEKERLTEVLDAGSKLAFKVWKLSPGLRRLTRVLTLLAVVLGLAGLGLAGWAYFRWGDARPLESAGQALTLSLIGLSVLSVFLAALLVYVLGRVAGVTRWLDVLARIVIGILLILLWPFALIHLRFFDKRYIECGKL